MYMFTSVCFFLNNDNIDSLIFFHIDVYDINSTNRRPHYGQTTEEPRFTVSSNRLTSSSVPVILACR